MTSGSDAPYVPVYEYMPCEGDRVASERADTLRNASISSSPTGGSLYTERPELVALVAQLRIQKLDLVQASNLIDLLLFKDVSFK